MDGVGGFKALKQIENPNFNVLGCGLKIVADFPGNVCLWLALKTLTGLARFLAQIIGIQRVPEKVKIGW